MHGEFTHLNINNIQPMGWVGVSYLIVFGSLAAYSAYVWLLQVRPATQVSTYAYVNPVIAVILGVVFAGEHISLVQISGLLVILASVLLINLAKYRKEKEGGQSWWRTDENNVRRRDSPCLCFAPTPPLSPSAERG